jgi:arylsulfatase A-like enzyme
MVKSQRCKYCAHDHGEHREALVNLESDPGEMVNLARDTKQHKVLAEYRQMLAE